MTSDMPWWRHALVYQVYLRSFADGNGDGTGDIAGLRSRLGHISSLGVDGLWVNPWYVSPLRDGGYDVADYRSINPLFGTLDEAKLLIEECRAVGLRLLVDLVPNHTSSDHPWFVAALAAEPGSRERARYHFVEGRGPAGNEPPNDWTSVFGGPAWTRVPDGQWYLHLFDPTQPDLNWDSDEVRTEFADILRFWLDLGAAGFRVDVAHGLVKEDGYPDIGPGRDEDMLTMPNDGDHPFWDRPEIHDIIRDWRRVLDGYDGTAMVAEAWVPDRDRFALYLRPDEYHQAFDFQFLLAPFDAKHHRQTIEDALTATATVGSVPTWVLSNHDVVRHATRFGLADGIDAKTWLLDGDRDLLDPELGLRRARAATLLMLALPGSAYLYQGEELGLPEVYDLDEGVLDDPIWDRSGHTEKGRDGCRVPIPWTRAGPCHGFGDRDSWLPQPEGWGELSVQSQEGEPRSTLGLYRQAIAIRAELLAGSETMEWLDLGSEVIAFRRGGGVVCVVNYGGDPVALPSGEVVISSAELEGAELPTDTAAWVRVG